MAFSVQLLLSVFLLATAVISASRIKNWDYFIFSQQWPASICIASNFTKNRMCEIPTKVTTWTVHGIWPSTGTTWSPSFCRRSAKFNATEIKSIRPDLEARWPNLYADAATENFWRYEWEKHGTCSMTMTSLDSEFKYFSMGLNLSSTYNLFKILSDGHIQPKDGHTYKLRDIISVLSDALGHAPIISCFYHKETTTQYIAEVKLCLSVEFKVIACPQNQQRSPVYSSEQDGKTSRVARRASVGIQRCVDTEPVVYPAMQHISTASCSQSYILRMLAHICRQCFNICN